MEIKRDRYLNKLISFMWDGQVKVITGIRRCGKSYLLKNLFRDYLISTGVADDHIIDLALDLTSDIRYRNPLELAKFVRAKAESRSEQFYLYVTGSNSKMLSSDILTEFRGRSDEIRVHPLSFAEYYSAVGGDKADAFDDYAFYGGMPLILSRPTEAAKMNYLQSLVSEVYLKDIVERKKIKREDVLASILDLMCSSVGSLTNPTNITNTINSKQKRAGENVVAHNTVKAYIDYLSDSFLFSECKRWDVKGKDYFDYPNKYYCEDIGLRNARIGFRQQEMTHIMENILYNELIIRECAVDVGVVYSNEKDAKGKTNKVAREIDFIATSGGKRTYIQSAYALPTEEKAETENKPFSLTGDSFPKVIVRHDIRKRWYDDNGILNIGITDFLLDDSLL